MSKVVWHPQKFLTELDRQLKRNTMKAIVFLQTQTKKNVSTPGRVHGYSAPGEYPHMWQGAHGLMGSIFRRGPFKRGGRIGGDVGTKLGYAIYHEIMDRPFLRRTLKEYESQILAILTGGAGPASRKGYRYSAAEIATVRELGAQGMSVAGISQQTGISQSHVRSVLARKSRIRGR